MSSPDEQGDWRRLHPVTPLLRSVQLLYAFIIGAVAARLGGPTVLVLVVTIGTVALVWITVGYLRYRYRVTEDSLIIHYGVLFRQRRVIPRSRIQNVDLRAGLLQQILGVVTARAETAGGQGTEALLHVVSREEGERLKDTLVALHAPLDSTVPMEDVEATPSMLVVPTAARETVLRRVSLGELVIAGATLNRAGLLFAALLGGDYFLDFMPTDWLLSRFIPPELMAPETAVNGLVQMAQHNVQAFLIGLLVLTLFGLAGWAIPILTSVMRYFDFTIAQGGGELRVSYGLLTRREKGFRRSRVQNVQIEESILRRWLGLASLRVQTAGYGPGVKADERVETLTPITRTGEIADYLSAVFPGFDWEAVEWRPSHPRARQRLFIRRALVIVLASVLLATFQGPWGFLLLVALAPAWFLAAAHYRHLGHAPSDPYVLTREGLWTRRTHIVPTRKIQSLHLKQSPFQRRLGLGTLAIETAGNPHEWHGPRSVDVGQAYGVDLQETLASDVTKTGPVF